MVLRAERLPIGWVRGGATVLPLDDVVGVEPDAAASALRSASRPLAAPVRALQDLQAPCPVLGCQQFGIGALRSGSGCPRVEGADAGLEGGEPDHDLAFSLPISEILRLICRFTVDASSIGLYNYKHRQRRRQQMFKIIDTKNNKVAFAKVSEHEAHKRVDLLNGAYQTTRFKAVRI